MSVVLVPGETGGRNVSLCGCCGSRYSVKKTVMWLSDGASLYGEICPECVLRGPRGAARRLENGLGDREGVMRERGGFRRSRTSASLGKRIARKLASLQAMESFPLEARQAAARELREKR